MVFAFFKEIFHEKGTLYQLKNLLNQTAVPIYPDKKLKAAKDFLTVLLHGYIITVANTISSKQSLDSVMKIVDNFLNINIPSIESESNTNCKDKLLLYAKEMLSL